MSNILYKRNYLENVIARIDFHSPEEHLSNSIPPKALEYIKRNFPITEPKTQTVTQLGLHLKSGKQPEMLQSDNSALWIFHGNNREKTLSINKSFITIVYNKYLDSSQFKLDFIETIKRLFEEHDSEKIIRIGLRYV